MGKFLLEALRRGEISSFRSKKIEELVIVFVSFEKNIFFMMDTWFTEYLRINLKYATLGAVVVQESGTSFKAGSGRLRRSMTIWMAKIIKNGKRVIGIYS